MINQINADLREAKKSKNTFVNKTLITLKGEIQRNQENFKEDPSDEEVYSTVKKMINNLNDTVAELCRRGLPYHDESHEIAILQKYTQPALSEDKIRKEVLEIIGSLEERTMKQMGSVFSTLKAKYKSQLDGAVASAIIKEELTK